MTPFATLAHLVALTSAAIAQAPTPSPGCQVDGRVDDILGLDGVFYAVGEFGTARPAGVAAGGPGEVIRTGAVAWDARSGAILPWAPTVVENGNPLAIETIAASPDGQTIYFGGRFDTVNGQPRRNLAAVNAQGQLTAWEPVGLPGGSVKDLEITADGNTIFAGGQFGVVAYSTVDGTRSPSAGFAPTFVDAAGRNSSVRALALSPDDSTLFVGGGNFVTVNGIAREGIAAVFTATGATTPFYPRVRDTNPRDQLVQVWDVEWSGGQVYVYGDWWETFVQGSWSGTRERQRNVGRFDPVTGAADPTFLPWTDGGIQGGAIDLVGGVAYIGGHFDQVGGSDDTPTTVPRRRDLCAFDLATGAVLPWRPGTTHSSISMFGEVFAVEVAAGFVAVGGEFETAGGVTQANLASFRLDGHRALLVVDDPAAMLPVDQRVAARLEQQLGFDVTVLDDDLGDGSEADGMDCVILSGSLLSTTVRDRYRDVTAPTLTWKASLLGFMGLTGGTWGIDHGTENLTDLLITDPAHPIVAGIATSAVALHTQPRPVVWGAPTASARIIARTVPGNAATLFSVRTGDPLVDGSAAAGSRIVFPLRRQYSATDPDLSPELWKLFDASIRHLVDSGGAAVRRVTSGCARTIHPLLRVRGVPRLNQSFRVELVDGPAHQPAALAFDFSRANPLPITASCAAITLSGQSGAIPATLDAAGQAGWQFSLGQTPALIDLSFALQALIIEPGGPVLGLASLSEGYELTIQP